MQHARAAGSAALLPAARCRCPTGLGYENIFRVAVVEFLDAHNFCLGRVKRSCIHFLTPAGQIIPFDTYNLFYRNGEVEWLRKTDAR